MITSAQIRAARAMLRWSAEKLAEEAKLGVATVRRADAADGEPPITPANAHAIRSVLEAAGIEFIPENGGGPGVRMRKLRLGDHVRPKRGTAFWRGDSVPLHNQWGKVSDMPDDGTSMSRITVSYPDGRQDVGCDAGLFELVPPHER